MCGKGIIFIDTFHMVRVLSNFAGLAAYATFPSGRSPGIDHSQNSADTVLKGCNLINIHSCVNDH